MKPLFVAMLALVLGTGLWAQTEVRQEIKSLGLTDAQVQDIVKAVRTSQVELEKARAEARVIQAQVARLLLDDSPSRADIEKLVRQGLEWDFKVRMLRIDRSLQIRAIVGKDKWALLSGLSLRLIEAEKAGKKPLLLRDDDQGSRRALLEVLRDLN